MAAPAGDVVGQGSTWGAFFQKVLRDDLPTQAAALAYCASLSVAPLIFLLFYLMSFIGLDLHAELSQQAHTLFGDPAAGTVTAVIDIASQGGPFPGGGSWIGILALFLAASAVVVQLHSALNQIFGPAKVESQIRAFLIQRGLSLLIVVAFIVLTVVSLFTSALLNALSNPEVELWGTVISTLFTFASFTLTLALLYRMVPDRPPSWRSCGMSSGLAAVLLMAGKAPLASFLGNSAHSSVYGAASSLILFLIWVYYSSFIIYLGAEFSNFLEQRAHGAEKINNEGAQVWSL